MQLAVSTNRFDLAAVGEETLVDLARQGDEGAIRALIKRHNQLLFRVARGIVRNDAEAEDVVQETYVRAFTHLETFRGEAKLSTWLTRIALNEALARVRRRRHLVELSELDTANGMNEGRLIMFPSSVMPASPETEAARGHIRQVLEETVDKLPDPFRMVFILRDVEGLSTEETAIHLSIKPETVKTRLHRARKLMRAALEESLSAAFGDLFPFDGARCTHVADRVVERLRQLQRD
ncbi:RNA polymerase sigma factor [Pseudaminobacter sp. NGMCC 1.201702]|uniref:RNA polymerase sigma factor n=1 Tax=Pseudaminobacter sp. NGMCC 1.201702 TaxID=3391825 RepID=UPI0039EE8E0A